MRIDPILVYDMFFYEMGNMFFLCEGDIDDKKKEGVIIMDPTLLWAPCI